MGQLAEVLNSVGNGRTIPGPMCGVERVLADLTGEDRDALNHQVSNEYGQPGVIGAIRLSLLLKQSGIDLSDNTIQRHRRGVCRCFK